MSLFDLFLSRTIADDPYDAKLFDAFIRKLYQFPCFKVYLDMIATKAKEDRVLFKIPGPKKGYLWEEGHCETVNETIYNAILNRVFRHYRHTIVIRKNTPEVIIHEIAHAIEKESGLDICRDGFLVAIESDFRQKRVSRINVLQAIKAVMYQEIESYKEQHKYAELFARYFQLFAMTQEVAGPNASHGLKLVDVEGFFEDTSRWVQRLLLPTLLPKIDPAVIAESNDYVMQDTRKIASGWHEKIRPIHSGEDERLTWRRNVKSLFNQDNNGNS